MSAMTSSTAALRDERRDHPELGLYIAGELIRATGHGTSPVLDPATGETIAELPVAGEPELEAAAEAAARGFEAWSARSPLARSEVLRGAARLIRERNEALAAAMTAEQGKPLAQSRLEWNGAAEIFEWAAEEGRRVYGRIIPGRNETTSLSVHHVPLGPVAAFAPWNFPAWSTAQKIAPALAAGCSVVVKPAEETPSAGLTMARALVEAGLPAEAIGVVFGKPAEISDYLIRSPVIRKITFTGSVPVGRQLAAAAGRELKRATMELGGHGPVIVDADTDLARAAELAVAAKFRNAGQVCVAPTRFFVQRKLYEGFVDAMRRGAEALVIGAGSDPATTMGPLANIRRLEAMDAFVADAVAHGARLVTGGRRLNRPGFFFQPTILAEVPDSARAMREEVFGPVALVNPYDELDEAIDRANALPFGLAAYAFTRSAASADRIRRRIRAGMLGINHYALALAEAPFGGVKDSGFGQEGGTEGVSAFLDTLYVSHMIA